jgi:hypothetical protein
LLPYVEAIGQNTDPDQYAVTQDNGEKIFLPGQVLENDNAYDDGENDRGESRPVDRKGAGINDDRNNKEQEADQEAALKVFRVQYLFEQ